MAQQNQTLDVLAAIQKLQGEEAKIANPTVSALSAAAKKFDPQDDAGLVFGGLLEGAALGAQAKADKQTKSRLDSMKQLYEQQLQYAQYSDELERYMKKAEATKKIAQDQQGAIDQVATSIRNLDSARASQFVNEQLRANPYLRDLLSNLADLEGGMGSFVVANAVMDDAGNLIATSTDGRTYDFGDIRKRMSPEGAKAESQAISAEWAAKTPVQQAEAQVGPLTDQEKRIAAGVAKAPQIQGTPQDFAMSIAGPGAMGGSAKLNEVNDKLAAEAYRAAQADAAKAIPEITRFERALETSAKLGDVSLAERGAAAFTGVVGKPSTTQTQIEDIDRLKNETVLATQILQKGPQTDSDAKRMEKASAIGVENSATTRHNAIVTNIVARKQQATRAAFLEAYVQETGTFNGGEEAYNRFLSENDLFTDVGNDRLGVNAESFRKWSNYLPSATKVLAPPTGMEVTNDGSSGGVPALPQGWSFKRVE